VLPWASGSGDVMEQSAAGSARSHHSFPVMQTNRRVREKVGGPGQVSLARLGEGPHSSSWGRTYPPMALPQRYAPSRRLRRPRTTPPNAGDQSKAAAAPCSRQPINRDPQALGHRGSWRGRHVSGANLPHGSVRNSTAAPGALPRPRTFRAMPHPAGFALTSFWVTEVVARRRVTDLPGKSSGARPGEMEEEPL
jgi:hypothetical protein